MEEIMGTYYNKYINKLFTTGILPQSQSRKTGIRGTSAGGIGYFDS